MYDELVDEPAPLSLSYSIISNRETQKQLIINLHQEESLSLYQAAYLVVEEQAINKKQAFEILSQMSSDNHTFRSNQGKSKQVCAVCLGDRNQHKRIQNLNIRDLTLEYIQDPQFQEWINESVNCSICYKLVLKQNITQFQGESHQFCTNCFKSYLQTAIESGKVTQIQCPHCSIPLNEEIIQTFTSKKIFNKYLKFKKNIEVAANQNCCWCPNAGCEQIIYFSGNKKDICPNCQTEICPQCKNKFHEGITCHENIQVQLNEWQLTRDTQQCPKCKFLVEKSHGCNHMTCQYCSHEWCWICGSDYTSIHFAFFNPFGCPALMPGWIRSKDWNITKLTLWRIMCFFLLLILTPFIVIAFGPVLCVAKTAQTALFQRQTICMRMFLILFALIIGILCIPVCIALFALLLLPGIIAVLWFYYEEKERLEARHRSAMFRHENELNP